MVLYFTIGDPELARRIANGEKRLDAEYQDMWQIKTLDALLRRSGHITRVFVSIIAMNFIGDIDSIVVYQTLTSLIDVLHKSFVKMIINDCVLGDKETGDDSFFSNLLGNYVGCIFVGARTRDGSKKFFNVLHVCVYSYVGCVVSELIMAHLLLPQEFCSPELMRYIINSSLQWGDTFAELIGAPFGGICCERFEVVGLGDVNQKSWEGVVAGMMVTFIASIITMGYYEETSVNIYIMALVLTINGSFWETISFRSTDNMTILIFNALCALFVTTF